MVLGNAVGTANKAAPGSAARSSTCETRRRPVSLSARAEQRSELVAGSTGGARIARGRHQGGQIERDQFGHGE